MNTSALLLAVDGGQTSTLALIATRSGQIIGTGQAGPANHIHEPGGYERQQRALETAIQAALDAAGQPLSAVSHACVGLSGASELSVTIARSLLPDVAVQVQKDMVTALAGASDAKHGIIVIAGTGSIAYGQNAAGETALAGGWGYIMGDEGSGYDLGRMALRAVSQAQDGRGPTTSLQQSILTHFDVADLAEVHRRIYSGSLTRPQIASLARVVAQSATAGDAVAQSILTQAGTQLADSALAVVQQLDFYEATVYTTGGVFGAGEMLLLPFRARLRARYTTLAVQSAAHSPIIGALLLALKAAGESVNARLLATMQQTMPAAAMNKLSTEQT